VKTIGLLGGMSWESTLEYYRAINQGVNEKLGGLHSAKIAMFSVDFQPVEQLQHAGDWKSLGRILSSAAQRVEAGGADCLVLCTNTMHKLADEIQLAIDLPMLHIADATAERLKNAGIETVGLLGTRFTMEEDFYKGRLLSKHGVQVVLPSLADRNIIHQVIYKELCLGIFNPESKTAYLRIIDDLVSSGAQAIILGCTEIGLLVNQNDTNTRLFDTTAIHAANAVEFALAN